MEEFKKNGVTIIFVSHSLPQIESFCSRAIYINYHQIICQGKTKTVTAKYYADTNNQTA